MGFFFSFQPSSLLKDLKPFLQVIFYYFFFFLPKNCDYVVFKHFEYVVQRVTLIKSPLFETLTMRISFQTNKSEVPTAKQKEGVHCAASPRRLWGVVSTNSKLPTSESVSKGTKSKCIFGWTGNQTRYFAVWSKPERRYARSSCSISGTTKWRVHKE